MEKNHRNNSTYETHCFNIILKIKLITLYPNTAIELTKAVRENKEIIINSPTHRKTLCCG